MNKSNLKNKILILTHHNWIPYIDIFHDLNPEQLIMIISHGLYDDSTIKKMKAHCSKVIEVDNYFASPEVELLAHSLLKEDPLIHRIVAPSERDLLRAAKLRDHFQLDGQQYDNAMIFRDKILMKNIVVGAGIKTPAFTVINSFIDILNFIKRHNYPVVLKPIRGTGSENTFKIESDEKLQMIITQNQVLDELHQSGYMIEKYINGIIYQMDGLILDGEMVVTWPSICVNNWLEIQSGKVVGRYFISPESSLAERLNDYTKKIVELFPLDRNSAFHIEVFHDAKRDEIVFCEIASRVGGIRAGNIWQKGFRFNIHGEFIRLQAGLKTTLDTSPLQEPKYLAGYMLFPSQVGKLTAVQTKCPFPWVEEFKPLLEVGTERKTAAACLFDLAATTVFYGQTEKQVLERVEEFMHWYSATTTWSNSNELSKVREVSVAQRLEV